VLTPLLTGGPGRGMIVNLSVDTSSVDLIAFAKDIDAFYIDTVVEPWPGLYTDRKLSISQRSNYALRESLLDLRRRRPGGVTAVSCCGANPGMVSWFVKQALLDVAAEMGLTLRRAEDARGLGAADAACRRQGHPYRRARHPARPRSEAARHVRQHLVGRGLLFRRPAAVGARLGHAREENAGERAPA
jgi:homospermidine synthase